MSVNSAYLSDPNDFSTWMFVCWHCCCGLLECCYNAQMFNKVKQSN